MRPNVVNTQSSVQKHQKISKKLFKYEVIQLRKKSIKFEDIGESDVEVIGESSEVPVPDNSVPVPSPDAEENGSNVEMRPRSQQSNISIESFVNKISKQKNDKLTELLSYAMISGDISFNWINNFYLKKFFKELNIGFKLSSDIIQTILNKSHEKAVEFNRQMISDSPFFTLTIDGWENTRVLEVLNIMVCVPKSIFYKSIVIRGEKDVTRIGKVFRRADNK